MPPASQPPRPPPHPRLTHFLAIPLITPSTTPQLLSSLQSFKKDVTVSSSSNIQHIPPRAIRPLRTLHLTIGVMRLENAERVRGAIRLLDRIFGEGEGEGKEKIGTGCNSDSLGISTRTSTSTSTTSTTSKSNPHTLPLSLHSLHPMHSPSRTSILYASPRDPEGYLQSFCQKLKETFTHAGYMIPEPAGRQLLLHATIVNTIYLGRGEHGSEASGGGRKGESSGRAAGYGHGGGVGEMSQDRDRGMGMGTGRGERGNRRRGGRREVVQLDVREVLERYRHYEWMTGGRVEKVVVCRMGARKGEDGEEEYEVEGEVQVPEFWV